MTPLQIELLSRLIDADRTFHQHRKNTRHVDWDWRGVEIGGLSDIPAATAISLERAGLVEIVSYGSHLRRAFLGSYEPI